jgi:hypothetical protein
MPQQSAYVVQRKPQSAYLARAVSQCVFLPQLVEHVCGIKPSIVTQLAGDDLQQQQHPH